MKLLYDIYHMQIMEGDVIRTIRENIAHIGHFHTAGNPDRKDLDDTQELNYAGICRAIARSGYGSTSPTSSRRAATPSRRCGPRSHSAIRSNGAAVAGGLAMGRAVSSATALEGAAATRPRN